MIYKRLTNFKDEAEDLGRMNTSAVVKLMEVQQMRAYDELRELDIEETAESLR